MNDTSQSHKITDFALKTLNAKNPTIDNPDNDTVISAHDVIHLIGHAGYTGDLNEKQPSINTSEHGEKITRITELVVCGYKATYDENGNFVRARTEDNFIEKHDELKDRYGVKELNILPSPLTLAEIKQELINSEIAEIRMDNLVDAIRSGDQSAKDAARLEKKKPFREHEGKIDIGITDQAIEYYMVRAELIRQQLERAGELDKLQDERINEIDPKLFAVRKEAVIAALEAKHGGAFSIKTQVPNNEIVSAGGLHKSPAEAKLVNNLGNGR